MVQEGSEDSGSDSDQNNQSNSDSKSDNANSAKSEASSGSDSDSKSEKSDDNEKFDTEGVKSSQSEKNNAASSPSAASSDSDSGSGSSKSGSSSSKSESEKRKTVKKESNSFRTKARRRASSELQPCWEKNPDIYGIRRSNRSRKEPERLTVESDSSEKSKKKTKAQWNSDSSSSEEYNSDTDQDVPSSKPLCRMKPNLRARAVQKKKQLPSRRKRFSSSDEESSVGSEDDSSRRHKSRRGQAVSYKEDSDEKTDSDDVLEVDNGDSLEAAVETPETTSETIEKVIAQRRGKKGVVGNQTTIYAIEENGDPNEGCDPTDLENTEVQFLIKWKGWSHIHNTWESESSLKAQKVKGLKKVENFLRKEEDIASWKRYATPEDAEYYECQLELQQDLLKSYNCVERIIAESSSSGTKEFYVKWQSLPYAEATWEDAALIERKWPACIREFREREDSKKTPSKLCRALKYRPKFNQFTTQPSYMGSDPDMELRDYQIHGVNWLVHAWCKENSVILADEMGLGKTIQTICFLYYLFHSHQVYGPFLVVVPLSTMTSWQREFTIWAPDINVVTYIGDVTSRNVIRDYEWCFANSKRLKFNAVLTTYEILLKDKAFLGSLNWAVLMVDEAHRLKNDDSLLYKALTDFITNHRLLITGTPLQNSLKELWALLHFIMPQKFESWEEFEKDHENAASKGYAKLHKQLEPFILRRVKKDVEKSLPAKVEQILRVEMTSNQKQYYRWILTKNYDALRRGAKGSTSSFLNIVVELKKCCNHSLLIKQPDTDTHRVSQEDHLQQLIRGSGKLVLLDKLLIRLRETGHRVLIFSQMVRMLDILAEYLQLRHFPFQRLDGGIKGEIRRQALDHFNAENSQDFCFLLSTRAGGLGINLATADTVIIFDSDWNPQNDLQAQARAHRIGQKNQVNIYRLVTKSSVEENIVERAKKKMVLDHLVIQRMDTTGRTVLDKKSAGSSTTPFNKEELTAILKFGAADLFKDDEAENEEPACDIDDILRRAETRDEAPAAVGDELLSAFKMANFVAVEEEEEPHSEHEGEEENNKEWDEIIPENFRAKVEAEEKEKELADSYLPPRVRKTLQQINQGDNDDKSGRRRRDGDSAGSSDEGSDDERPRKRGRPRASAKDAYKGFTDAEIRRFVKSYKKFPEPLKRLEAVACDAELQEKPLADLRKLGTYLREQCVSVMNDMKNSDQAQADEATNTNTNKRKNRGPSFKIGGVAVNAKTVLSCEQDLEPLDKILPVSAEERSRWTLNCRVKFAHFDVDWDAEDDSKLLRGIYQYGMGSWEAIKMDPSFGISEKILPNDGAKKPQAKHLQARAEYLLKILRKQMSAGDNVTAAKAKKVRKARESRESKYISKDIINDDDSSDDDSPPKSVNEDDKSNNSNVAAAKEEKKSHKKEVVKKEPKKKKDKGPLHITANNEPVEIRIAGDLDPTVFNQCKEMMRPVKKALRALSNPNNALSPEEQLILDKKRILECGEHIDKCLAQYKDPETMKTWRGNLWYFVSKFTSLEPKDLYKVYKRTLLRRKGPETTSNAETSPLPIKKKRLEEKSEKKHSENQKNSPVKHKSDKSEKPSTDGHHRESRNDFVEHANRENRDRDIDDRQKHRDKEKLKDRERSKKESSLNASQSHQYRSSHDHRGPSTNNPPRNHEGPSSDRWRSSSSNSRYPGPGSDPKRKRYDYPRSKGFPREHESSYGRDFSRMHADKRNFADYARYAAALPGSGAYPNHFLSYYPGEPAHAMYSSRDGRYPPGHMVPYSDWPHAMMNHDRGDYHSRDYDRRPPPTNS